MSRFITVQQDEPATYVILGPVSARSRALVNVNAHRKAEYMHNRVYFIASEPAETNDIGARQGGPSMTLPITVGGSRVIVGDQVSSALGPGGPKKAGPVVSVIIPLFTNQATF